LKKKRNKSSIEIYGSGEKKIKMKMRNKQKIK